LLLELAERLDVEQRRAAEEGLSDGELALFDLWFREKVSKADGERLKQATKTLLASLQVLLTSMPDRTQNTATQAEVKIFNLDTLWQGLRRPPYTDDGAEDVAATVYDYVWQRSAGRESLVA
jgi:type I restriction enzyme R subunit